MNAPGLIAKRYLFSRRHLSLINALTFISVAGITVGTALLIVVLSVFNGFFDVIKSLLMSNDPDLRIESAEGRSFSGFDLIGPAVNDIPEIALMSPYIQGKVLIAHRGNREQVALVRGIEPELFHQFTRIETFLTSGRTDLGVENQKPGVLIPENLSRSLRMNVGDEVALLSATGMQRALTQFTGPRISRFEVRGIYHLEQIMEDPVLYIDMLAAQKMFGMRNEISGIDIALHDHGRADEVRGILQNKLGESFRIKTWYDLQKPLYDVMNLEKWGAYFILMIIVLVAVLNIVGSLTMIVIQKNRDIGLLRAIGLRKKDIRNIFLRQGGYIGTIGCVLGGSTGLLLCYLQDRYGLVKLAGAESFLISAYPVQVLWPDVFFVLGGSLLLCTIASGYPAMRAASIEPADAVRND